MKTNKKSLIAISILAAIFTTSTAFAWTEIFKAEGDALYQTGKAIAHAGNQDGDGTPDYLETRWDQFVTLTASVNIRSGATNEIITTLQGSGSTSDGFGTDLNTIGDTNGDGYDEIAIWSASYFQPGNLIPPLGGGQGAIDIYDGFTHAIIASIYPEGGDTLIRLTKLGDINSDGSSDFAYRSWNQLGQTFTYIVSGFDFTNIRSHTGLASAGPSTSKQKISGNKDVNGDNIPDYAINTDGTLTVYNGATGVAIGFTNGFQSTVGFELVDDINGDGMAEIMHKGQATVATTQTMKLYYGGAGPLFTEAWSQVVPINVTNPGSPLNSGTIQHYYFNVKDYDNDGIRDIVELSHTNSPGGGRTRFFSSATGVQINNIQFGLSEISLGGNTTATKAFIVLGDLTNDGKEEFVLATNAFNNPGVSHPFSEGAVRVISYDNLPVATATVVGQSCGGGGALLAVTPPVLGTTNATLSVTGGQPNTAVNLVLAAQAANPIEVLPGCYVYGDLNTIMPFFTIFTDANGNGSVTFSIPNYPALTGFPLVVQGYTLSPMFGLTNGVITAMGY